MPPSILKNGSNRRPRTDVTPQVRPANSDMYRMTSYKPVRSFDDATSDASFPREVSLDDDVTVDLYYNVFQFSFVQEDG